MPGQGLPRELGTSNLISRTLAKLKALRFLISDFGFQISDFVFCIFSEFLFKITDLDILRFWIFSDFRFCISKILFFI